MDRFLTDQRLILPVKLAILLCSLIYLFEAVTASYTRLFIGVCVVCFYVWQRWQQTKSAAAPDLLPVGSALPLTANQVISIVNTPSFMRNIERSLNEAHTNKMREVLLTATQSSLNPSVLRLHEMLQDKTMSIGSYLTSLVVLAENDLVFRQSLDGGVQLVTLTLDVLFPQRGNICNHVSNTFAQLLAASIVQSLRVQAAYFQFPQQQRQCLRCYRSLNEDIDISTCGGPQPHAFCLPCAGNQCVFCSSSQWTVREAKIKEVVQ